MYTNFTRGTPTKFGRVKTSKNSARFVTTFDLDRKYLPNGSTYRKSEKYLINYISSPIGRKKFGELWSTNQKVIGAMLTHPTALFSGNYISAPRRAGPSNFTRPTSPTNCISSRTWGAGRPHVGLCPIFFYFFNQTQDLRAPSANRRETLHSDQHMRQLFNACPKIRGVLP